MQLRPPDPTDEPFLAHGRGAQYRAGAWRDLVLYARLRDDG